MQPSLHTGDTESTDVIVRRIDRRRREGPSTTSAKSSKHQAQFAMIGPMVAARQFYLRISSRQLDQKLRRTTASPGDRARNVPIRGGTNPEIDAVWKERSVCARKRGIEIRRRMIDDGERPRLGRSNNVSGVREAGVNIQARAERGAGRRVHDRSRRRERRHVTALPSVACSC